jgi:TorA maturation chaperone TorD
MSAMSDAPAAVPGSAYPEDRARADFYALLARLFADPPDADLLRALATAPPLAAEGPPDEPGATSLPAAWDALRVASAEADPAAVADEHQALFVGVGRSAVSPYGSHYIAPQSGRLLAELRGTLAELGLSRRPEASTYEDHLASVLETMRFLAVGDVAAAPAALGAQRTFFERYIASWAFDCCAAIIACPIAIYYARVAQFAQLFLALERDSFAME